MSEESLEHANKLRRRQVDNDGNTIQTLLNSLTLEHIREAISRLAPSKKITLRTHLQSFDALLSTGKSTGEIEKVLLEVERAHPFKHCLVLRLDSLGSSFEPPAISTVFRNGDYEFTLTSFANKPIISLTFEHSVEFKEWVEVAPDMRRRRTVVTRQPIVVRVLPAQQILTLNYPGYTHSNSQSTNLSGYESVIASLLNVLRGDKFGWKLRVLPIKESLKFLLEGQNSRVSQVKADVDTPMARLDVSAKGESINIEEALATFISEYLPDVDKAELINASKKAFNGATANSIVLYWMNEGLFTRLRFWDIGTELFFVWNKGSATYHFVDGITSTLSETCFIPAVDSGEEASQVLSWISALPSRTVITPGELAQKFALSPGAARSSLLTSLKAGLVEPVYRVATSETLQEFPNNWTDDLVRLKTILITVNGASIDGSNPSNIEVAFQRVGLTVESAQ